MAFGEFVEYVHLQQPALEHQPNQQSCSRFPEQKISGEQVEPLIGLRATLVAIAQLQACFGDHKAVVCLPDKVEPVYTQPLAETLEAHGVDNTIRSTSSRFTIFLEGQSRRDIEQLLLDLLSCINTAFFRPGESLRVFLIPCLVIPQK